MKGKYVEAPPRACGSSIAFSCCKFAGEIKDIYHVCNAESEDFSDCPYAAKMMLSVFDEKDFS